MKKELSIASFCVKEHERKLSTKSHQLPIFATSSFEFDSIEEEIDVFEGNIDAHSYSRYGNPTIDTVAAKIAKLESFNLDGEAYGFLTSSGMSAISILALSILKSGDTILTQSDLYGGTTVLFDSLFTKLGIKTIFADLKNPQTVREQLLSDPSIKLIYLESPSNPVLNIIDLTEISAIAAAHGVLTAIDNTFCTPIIQRPLEFGIDFVIHSTTKYLNGHGNSISGAIVGIKDGYRDKIHSTLKLYGSTCNSWDAWLINNGLKTLALRMEKHSENAIELANFLNQHSNVKSVNYCGLKIHPQYRLAQKQMSLPGGMLSFEINGGQKRAVEVLNSLNLCSLVPTLGDVDTLVLHPATSSHLKVDIEQRLRNGVTDGLIRVSTGIESIEDIISDFEKALK